MQNDKTAQWVLRLAIAGEFIGHGALALEGKKQWVGWISQLTGAGTALSVQFLFLIGLLDIMVALVVLSRPIRIVLFWAAIWGFWTAIVRPMVGESALDFVERAANWGAPLALLLLMGWPKKTAEWFK